METVTPYEEIIGLVREAGGEDYKLCYQCGKCDAVCPWNRVRAFSMRKIVRQASLGLSEIEQEEIWRCTTCGACVAQCPRGVPQIRIGVSLRRIATQYGVFPDMIRAAGTAAAALRIDRNPLGEPAGRRADWAKGLPVKTFTEGTDLLFFVGCYYSYDPRLKKAAAATARILAKAGVDFGILGEAESCCGESMRKTGGEAVFRGLARENIKAFIDRGVRRILVCSPHCYETFRRDYADLMVSFDVVHVSQYLLRLMDEGRLVPAKEYRRRVAYHDPCYLGRHNGIYEEPREVLRRVPGLELVEMSDRRQGSLCCGGGGGGIWTETAKAERLANLRLAQAREAGAQVLATACPYCIANFEDSRLTLGYEEVVEVRDITEIVDEVV
ncbi:MAG: (Fe-S)-binding protein [Deltaproteobacteria bacterium]|nr:(Fe-S)-binding protein [Deltaproteobacteria bacterium]